MSDHKPGRNEPCPCGSGRKYKQCCLHKDEEAAREQRAQAAAEAAEKAAAEKAAAEAEGGEAKPAPATQAPKAHGDQPWRRGQAINTHGFRKTSGARKIGSG